MFWVVYLIGFAATFGWGFDRLSTSGKQVMAELYDDAERGTDALVAFGAALVWPLTISAVAGFNIVRFFKPD